MEMCESRSRCPHCSENQSGFQIRSSICLSESPWCTWWNGTLVRSCCPFITQIRTSQIQNSSARERERVGERRKLSDVWNDISMRNLPLSWQLKSKFYEDEEHGVTWADLTCCKGLNFWGMELIWRWQFYRASDPSGGRNSPARGISIDFSHVLFYDMSFFWMHLCDK